MIIYPVYEDAKGLKFPHFDTVRQQSKQKKYYGNTIRGPRTRVVDCVVPLRLIIHICKNNTEKYFNSENV